MLELDLLFCGVCWVLCASLVKRSTPKESLSPTVLCIPECHYSPELPGLSETPGIPLTEHLTCLGAGKCSGKHHPAVVTLSNTRLATMDSQ